MALPALTTSRPLLADGAMATNLFDRGLVPGDPPEAWNADHPDRVQALHRDFVAAGADILLTNSFGGHPWRLRPFGLAGRTAELNRHAAHHARAAAEGAGRPVLVAGAVGPTGERAVTAEAAAGFALQMQALAAGGVDLLWIETMSYAEEIRMAVRAAAARRLPFVVTASFDARGRTLGGLDAAGFARLAAEIPAPPLAIGVNCGTGPAALLRDLAALRAAAPQVLLVSKGSAGLPTTRQGRLHYPASPADMRDGAVAAVAAGACVVGGCCGTTPAHLAAMRAGLSRALPDGPELACTAAPS